MKVKEALVHRSVHLKPLLSLGLELLVLLGIAPIEIIKEKVSYFLISQSLVKVLGLDKINFWILGIIWD